MSRKRRGRGGHGGRPQITYQERGRSGGGVRELPRVVRAGQVIDLGDLSDAAPAREPVDARFTYFGERFRVNPDLSEVDVMDFMDEAQHVNPDDPTAFTLVKRWVAATVHPEDFTRFWKLSRSKRQDSTSIMALMWQILDGVTDLPTGQPSDSSGGLPNTSQNSPAGSSAPAVPQSTPAASPADLYGPVLARPVAPGAEPYLRQIDRFQERGDGFGVAMAAQIATMAEARGIAVRRDRLLAPTG